MKKEFFLEKVNGSSHQIFILFNLLKNRTYNISHSILPSYKDHTEFVLNHPYKVWYLVFYNSNAIGTFYINYDNSIGLNLGIQNIELIEFIINYIRIEFKPEPAISSLVPSYFYFNISKSNLELQKIFNKLNINSFQVSYKI